jgi:hypothetical protein
MTLTPRPRAIPTNKKSNKHETMNRFTRNLLAIGVAGTTLLGSVAFASSHREAPLITEDPTADSTDVYAFISPDGPAPGNGATVTMIANYIPFQEPAGGPNYFNFSDEVLYEIKVDNTGDAVEDIVYQFRFRKEIANGDTFLYNVGPIDTPANLAANLNQKTFYSVTRVDIAPNGQRSSSVLAQDLMPAPARIGPRSNGSQSQYETLTQALSHDLQGGGKVFVGPRDEGFFLDINAIFDLLNISRTDGLGDGTAVDGTAGFNVSSIAIQIPVTQLTADQSEPTLGENLGGDNAVLGIWTTASRRKHKVLRRHDDPRDFGPWVQVSRLGLPLINEVVVPVGFKDQFNRSQPSDDLANIAGYVVDPELSRLLAALYEIEVPAAPRADMVAVISFLPGALTSRDDLQPADILRLNVAIPAAPQGQEDRLGVIGGDVAGFPNGRRPGDDVVDILERVVGGGVLAEGFGELFPNNALNDGVDGNDVPFLTSFPYLATPHEGFVHEHAVHPQQND